MFQEGVSLLEFSLLLFIIDVNLTGLYAGTV